MKRVTASEARRNWFRLLDEVAAGEVVIVERRGRAIQLRRAPEIEHRRLAPDYSALVGAPQGVEDADLWGWEWSEEDGDLKPTPDPGVPPGPDPGSQA